MWARALNGPRSAPGAGHAATIGRAERPGCNGRAGLDGRHGPTDPPTLSCRLPAPGQEDRPLRQDDHRPSGARGLDGFSGTAVVQTPGHCVAGVGGLGRRAGHGGSARTAPPAGRPGARQRCLPALPEHGPGRHRSAAGRRPAWGPVGSDTSFTSDRGANLRPELCSRGTPAARSAGGLIPGLFDSSLLYGRMALRPVDGRRPDDAP